MTYITTPPKGRSYSEGMEFMYITVEDYSDTERLDCVLDELLDTKHYDTDIFVLEKSSGYFVLKVEYNSFEDIKDLGSTITYSLLQYGISSFRMIYAGEELNNYDY